MLFLANLLTSTEKTFSRKKESSSRDLELWPVTLIYDPDLDRVKVNHHAIYLPQSSKVIVQTQSYIRVTLHTHIPQPTALSEPPKWAAAF